MICLSKKWMWFGMLFVMAATGAASPGPARAEETLTIGGSGSWLGVIQVLAKAYTRRHPEVAIKVPPSLGTEGGIKAVLQGELDIALISRPLKDPERAAGATAVETARTPFVFVTSSKSVSLKMSTVELEKIFSGEVQSWPDGTHLRLVLRPEREATTIILKGISPGMDSAVNAALIRPGMTFAVTDQEAADLAEKTPGSFSSLTLTQILTEKRNVRVFAFNGVRPGVKTLASEAYPLFKPLYLTTTPKTRPAALHFIEFIRSKAGKKILEENGCQYVEGSGTSRP